MDLSYSRIVAYEKGSDETHAVKIDDCVVAYMKYTAEAGFVVRRSCKKRLRNGDVKQKKHVSDFSFDYFVENADFSVIFWADEVSKYNYREFGHVISFDATFKTNKYKMEFVPFTAIDNHRKCVTVVAAFIKAFGKTHSIVVTDQDGAMRNTIEAEFAGSKHRLCMWHITQKLPAKKKKPQSLDKGKDKAEEENIVDLFFKKDGLYKALLLKTKVTKKDVKADCPNPPSKNKTDNLEQLVGVSKPAVVDVNNPYVGSTKGRRKLHIKGEKEKAIEKCLKARIHARIHVDCVAVSIITKGHARGGLKFKMKLWLKRSVSKGSCGSKRSVLRGSCLRKVDLAKDEEELVEKDEDLIHE
nr:hypothetical protein [Tanacetum cinerariifolium]